MIYLADECVEVQKGELTCPGHKANWQSSDSNPGSLNPGCTFLTIGLVCLPWAKYHVGLREGIQINT